MGKGLTYSGLPYSGDLLSPTERELTGPGDDAFRKLLLRVSLKEGVLEDNLSDIGFGQHLRENNDGGGSNMTPAERQRRPQSLEMEKRVRELIEQGKGQAEISKALGISYARADYWVRKVMRKNRVAQAEPEPDRPVPAPSNLPEKAPEVDIDTLRDKWQRISDRDQTLACLAQRILSLIDELEDNFGDMPVLNSLANQSVAVLAEHYQQIAGERVGE
jgi:DNA-binding CsgD family transcriptional regulator